MSTTKGVDSPLARTRRARRINRMLAAGHPDAHCELDFTTPLELLVATVLSAQCTDVRVNQVTPALFAAYPTAAHYADADRVELEEMIRPTGFYKAKAGHLIGLGQRLVAEYGGEVPRALEDLVTLPGVGRKTANVVRGDAFGVPGITVDTHFGRLMKRFGLTEATDPVVVEKEICAQIPKKEWTIFSHRVIFHGRRVCHSRKPACGVCFLRGVCPSSDLGEQNPAKAEKMIKGDRVKELIELAREVV